MTQTFRRFAGWAALDAAFLSVFFTVTFALYVREGYHWAQWASSIALTLTGVATVPVFVALHARVREAEPEFALLALITGLVGGIGSTVHGAYDVAVLAKPVSEKSDFPSQIDPRGFLTFAVTGLALGVLVVPYQAVIFDLGGVVMPSPLDAFREYERQHGLPHRFLSEVVISGGEAGAWSRLERGELTMDEFGMAFAAECTAAGGNVSVADLFAAIHDGSGPRPAMLTAVARIREEGLKTAALTNNWVMDDGTLGSGGSGENMLAETFDVVVESAVEGLRKPDPRIYEVTCDRLGVSPSASVFLDDLGVNLKPARALGMTTIKVDDPSRALAELEQTLGFSLSNGTG